MLIVYGLDGDPESPVISVTTPGANVARAIKNVVGVGNPYYVFASIPFNYGLGILVNWSGAPLASETLEDNAVAMIAMLETPPLDKIRAP